MSAHKFGRRFEGKVAIITGSTKGIGFAIARRFLQEGASVVISSRKSENVQEAVDSLKAEGLTNCIGIPCHVGAAEDRKKIVADAVAKFGKVDILVNNAAVNPWFGATLDTPEKAWDKIMELNVKAALLLCKEVVPVMREKSNGGAILNISSIGGYNLTPPLGAYAVSKTAMFGLTRLLAVELAPDNIRVNCLAPGVIKTYMSELLWKSPEAERHALSQIPLGRIGVPDDCAGPAAYFCSDDASYITGEIMCVAGGNKAAKL